MSFKKGPTSFYVNFYVQVYATPPIENIIGLELEASFHICVWLLVIGEKDHCEIDLLMPLYTLDYYVPLM